MIERIELNSDITKFRNEDQYLKSKWNEMRWERNENLFVGYKYHKQYQKHTKKLISIYY